MTEPQKLSIGIADGFIEKMAVEKLQSGNIKTAIEFLEHCLKMPDANPEQRFIINMRLLNGSAKTFSDGRLSYDNNNNETLNSKHPIFTQAAKMKEDLDIMRDEIRILEQRLGFISGNINENERIRLSKEYRDEHKDLLFGVLEEDDIPMSELADFVKFTRQQKHESEIPYGWLEPDGTFHKALWGDHHEWACEYVMKNYHDELPAEYETDMPQFLREKKHWILVHSPSQSVPDFELCPGQTLTKHQRDWLYDMYNDIGFPEKADALFKENI